MGRNNGCPHPRPANPFQNLIPTHLSLSRTLNLIPILTQNPIQIPSHPNPNLTQNQCRSPSPSQNPIPTPSRLALTRSR